jgi:DNA-binding NtrC family response regulator
MDSHFRTVIFDMVMPLLGGADLLDKIQTEKRLKHIPVIIMRASDDAKLLSDGIKAGASAFLSKPFTPDRFRNILRVITRTRDEIAPAMP